ncbi:Pectinesterase [Heracleum sosnowskyi]|uniref:Pectinesterase n=1 Tax=Heracleum sosnowskyi TaxID=360622 RepID=A0AAD8JBT7_9APIA|nr:Pectinesterase [Heracleum sosnowskyi]
MMDAENQVSRRVSQTPLLGGENLELHPSDSSGVTPEKMEIQIPNLIKTPSVAPIPGGSGLTSRVGITPSRDGPSFGRTPKGPPIRDELHINDNMDMNFILGNAAVVLQNCNIYPRLPLQGQFDPITAQGRTDINQNTGTSIQNCTITAAEDLATTKTYLGRPWKEYSRVVVIESFLDSLIDPAGWSIWDGDFALNTLYYGEYNNRGPGSDTSKRVTWPGYHVINSTDAGNFTVSNFLGGDSWLPKTGVPWITVE